MPATKVDIDAYLKSIQQDYRPRANAAIRRAIRKFGWYVLGVAQELCPVKTGFLMASAFATEPTGEGTMTTMEIGFNAGYALYVHENLAVHHPQGQAKFLEIALQQSMHLLPQYVMEELKAEFG
jgi:hypothetical protein